MLTIDTKKISPEVVTKYSFQNNTFTAIAKDNPKDKVEVLIGDAKETDFLPRVKIQRWDNEVNFSVGVIPDAKVTPQVITEGEVIKWQTPTLEAHFYDKPDASEEGGYEFEVVLKKKPASNIIPLSIETKGLEFFKQLALTKEEIEQGAERPENVVNSYAVYYKNCPANYVGGKEYKAGKAFHIYRVKATDSQGNWTWCDQEIDEVNKRHNLIIPQKFLDEAVYPMIVDPTFGYTSAGASGGNINGYAGIYGTPDNAGTIVSVSHYQKTTSTVEAHYVKSALYNTDYSKIGDSGTQITVPQQTESSGAVLYTETWSNTVNFSATEMAIFITGWRSSDNTVRGQVAYDSVTNAGKWRYTYNNFAWNDPFSSPYGNGWTTNNDKYSIYATYTASAAGTNMKINIGDVWKDVSEMKINIGDAWKAVTKAQINIGDSWKTIFGS